MWMRVCVCLRCVCRGGGLRGEATSGCLAPPPLVHRARSGPSAKKPRLSPRQAEHNRHQVPSSAQPPFQMNKTREKAKKAAVPTTTNHHHLGRLAQPPAEVPQGPVALLLVAPLAARNLDDPGRGGGAAGRASRREWGEQAGRCAAAAGRGGVRQRGGPELGWATNQPASVAWRGVARRGAAAAGSTGHGARPAAPRGGHKQAAARTTLWTSCCPRRCRWVAGGGPVCSCVMLEKA